MRNVSDSGRSSPASQRQFLPEPLESRVLFAVPSGFEQSTLGTGLTQPTSMAFAPDGTGRLFVCEQEGDLRIVDADGRLRPSPFVHVPALSGEERGLLGIAFAPDFATTRHVYVYWTQHNPGRVQNTVTRYTASASDPNVAEPNSRLDLFVLPNNGGANHQGGAIHFGPDGKLYVAVGEHGNPSDAQNLATPFGKLLRINRDGTIPDDNPFYNQTTGHAQAIWAYGLRNPFTFAFHPDASGKVFVNDVGAGDWEEIDDVQRGKNYGWPSTEGAFDPARFPDFTNPVGAYGSDGCAITGGVFYQAPAGAERPWPASYTGKYFFADYCRTYVKSFDPATAGSGAPPSGVVNLDSLPYFATQVPARPVDVDVAPSGDVYVLSRGAESGGTGLIGVIRYTASDVPSINEQPQSRTVTAGQPVTFRVVASGPGPLSYQWQRNGVDIPGATDTSYTIDRVQATDDGARFRVVVRNPHGSTPSNEAVLTVTENRAPTGTITITAPSGGGLYTAGGPISFSGSATDPEQGTLPAGAFTWRVDFHHDEHFHPAMPETTGSTTGTYNVPTAGETSANVWYRVHLTVTDEGGLTHSTFTDVHPQTAQVTLATNPTGLSLDLDGQPRTAPHVFSGVTGIVRSLAAPPTQTVGGVTYEFVGWSDGGAPQHTISTPASNTTYTATYRRVARVLGRQVFYSRSRFDSDGAASGPGDDGAIATDKAALLPGQTASFANYTSYGRGINGIMIDLDNGGAPVGAADFTFRAGRDGDPAAWDLAPQPLRIERRAGAGAGGSDRVTVVWADGAIRNKWLQVTYLPQGAPASSLSRDVFYFGNLVGEIGDAASLARVSATDLLETRRKLRTSGLPLTDRHDVNRDGRISVTDFALIRRNLRTTLPAVATGTAVFSATPISAASISDEVLGS